MRQSFRLPRVFSVVSTAGKVRIIRNECIACGVRGTVIALLVLLAVFCQVGSAALTADQMLEELHGIPRPDETINDRGLRIEALIEYVDKYVGQAARFRQHFPDHPRAAEIADQEVSLVIQMQSRSLVPAQKWDAHLAELKRWNPEVVARNNFFRRDQVSRLLDRAREAREDSPETFRKACREAFNWTAANADYGMSPDCAYEIVTGLGQRWSEAESDEWFERFRQAFPDDPRSQAKPDPNPAVEIGQALTLTFKDVQGREIDTGALKGKVVVIDFWATWCGPCHAAAKVLKELYAEYGNTGRLEIIGVSMDRKKEDLDKFLAGSPYPWPIAWDAKGYYSKRWKFGAIPHFLIIDQGGVLRFNGNTSQVRKEVLKYLDPLAVHGKEEIPGFPAEVCEPLTEPNASADEMFEALETTDEPDRDALAAQLGSETVRDVFPLYEAAHAAKLCDTAWTFLQRYRNDPRCGRVLEIWAGWINDKKIAANPGVVTRVMGDDHPDFARQIAWLRGVYGRDHSRLIDLAELIHDAQTAEALGRQSKVYGAMKKRITDFCEARPDDRLNVPAFFRTMGALERAFMRRDPAKECSVPLRLMATDLQGRAIDSAAWQGKVVFVYFSYYPQSHLPMLRELWRRFHGRGLEIVEINVDSDRSNVEAYVRTGKAPFRSLPSTAAAPIPWPVVMEQENPPRWCLSWRHGGYASMCVVNQQGYICHTASGWASGGIKLSNGWYRIDPGDVVEVIESLLNQ